MSAHKLVDDDLDAIDAELVQLDEAEALEKARNGLLNFTCYTFPEFEVNWHHRQLARILNEFAHGLHPRLIICLPPRCTKSEFVSRRLPAFLLGLYPDDKVLTSSYSAELASAMNRDVQRIIDSPQYEKIFPDSRIPKAGMKVEGSWARNSKHFEIIGRRGGYRCAGVGGPLTGYGTNWAICDDPFKNQEEADSIVFRDRIWNWWRSTFYTRFEKNANALVTMTRWHEDDLVGRLLNLAKSDPTADQWEVVSFPAIAEGAGSVGSVKDPREIGEPLWPNKFSVERLAALRSSVGSRVFSALYQQRPAPEEGMIIKREWWRFWKKLPQSFEVMIQAWDLTFTNAATSDYVVGAVFGKLGPNIYLVDMVRGRLGFTESTQAIKNLARKWPQASAIYVEKAANGHAVIDTLQRDITGVIGVKPLGSKVARANAVSPRIEAGNVWLPDPSICPWVNEVVEEWATFPAGMHDDIVDAMSHGIAKLAQIGATDFLPVSVLGTNT